MQHLPLKLNGCILLMSFLHCLDAMDGKYIVIKCPKDGGSLYFNYKKIHSIILMALVDADYKFIWIVLGDNGSASDAQIFNSSELRECIESGDNWVTCRCSSTQ